MSETNTTYTDALELAFDQIKALEAAGKDSRQAVSPHAYAMAQLWTSLAVAVELRLLRQEWAAREAAWDARRVEAEQVWDGEEGDTQNVRDMEEATAIATADAKADWEAERMHALGL